MYSSFFLFFLLYLIFSVFAMFQNTAACWKYHDALLNSVAFFCMQVEMLSRLFWILCTVEDSSHQLSCRENTAYWLRSKSHTFLLFTLNSVLKTDQEDQSWMEEGQRWMKQSHCYYGIVITSSPNVGYEKCRFSEGPVVVNRRPKQEPLKNISKLLWQRGL